LNILMWVKLNANLAFTLLNHSDVVYENWSEKNLKWQKFITNTSWKNKGM